MKMTTWFILNYVSLWPTAVTAILEFGSTRSINSYADNPSFVEPVLPD